MIRTLLTFLLGTACFAQSIQFSPQGASALKALTGKRIKGVQIVSVIACPAVISIPSISGGELYSAAITQGYEPILPQFAAAVITDAAASNKWQIALEVFRVASIAAIVAGTRSLNATQLLVINGAHQIGDELSSRIQTRLPNPAPLISALLDPEKTLDITHGCQVSAILAVYPSEIKPPKVKHSKQAKKSNVPVT